MPLQLNWRRVSLLFSPFPLALHHLFGPSYFLPPSSPREKEDRGAITGILAALGGMLALGPRAGAALLRAGSLLFFFFPLPWPSPSLSNPCQPLKPATKNVRRKGIFWGKTSVARWREEEGENEVLSPASPLSLSLLLPLSLSPFAPLG